jgi:hypothetical protein
VDVNEMSSQDHATVGGVHGQPVTSSTCSSVTVDSRVSGVGSSLPTISSASWRALTLFGVHRVHGRAAADHGDLVGHLQHLVELVRDEQHGEAFVLSSRRLSKSSSTSCGRARRSARRG